MIIYKTYSEGEVCGIRVDSALPVELIAAELFEACDPRWLTVWGVSEGPDGVTGSFRITADNGEWTYRLTRRSPHLDGVFEAELALGEPLMPHFTTVAARSSFCDPVASE